MRMKILREDGNLGDAAMESLREEEDGNIERGLKA